MIVNDLIKAWEEFCENIDKNAERKYDIENQNQTSMFQACTPIGRILIVEGIPKSEMYFFPAAPKEISTNIDSHSFEISHNEYLRLKKLFHTFN